MESLKLERSFYEKNTLKVAQDLLNCILVHNSPEGTTSGKIVETEAYLGPEDKAAHSYGGRHTPRMDPLYMEGGFAYVYQLHGHNYCLNAVTQNKSLPQAVLIRSIEPVEGLELMARRRGMGEIEDIKPGKLKNLTNGPSKLCQAMGIDTSLNGIDMCGDELFITAFENQIQVKEIVATPRINIDYAEEYKNKLWRFLVKGNKLVSRISRN
jgi:DNA-3-methyladenine glycosylase